MKITILLGMAMILAGSASAAIVILKDGGRLEGTVLRDSGGQLVLQTAQGTVSIPSANVQTIEYGEGGPAAAPVPAAPPEPLPPRRRRRRYSDEELFGAMSQNLSIDLGLAAPLSDINFSGIGGGSASNGTVGPLIGVQYLHDISSRLAAGAELQYASRGATDSPGLLPNSEAHVFGDSVVLLALLKCFLADRGRARPFILVGIGADDTSTTVDAHPDFGFAWSDTGTAETRRLIDGSAWSLASTVRLGVDFDLRHADTLTLEAGWMGMSSASYGATGQGAALGLSGVSAALEYFTLAARWGFRF